MVSSVQRICHVLTSEVFSLSTAGEVSKGFLFGDWTSGTGVLVTVCDLFGLRRLFSILKMSSVSYFLASAFLEVFRGLIDP